MVIKANKAIFGDDWFQTIAAFRVDPKSYLDKKKLSRDAFCLDILKDLYLDHVELQYKIHLLLLLQENSTLLIADKNLLEQVVGSLMNLIDVLGKKADKRILKSQVTVAIVTILLTQNLSVSNLVVKATTMLLTVIYDSSEDSTVISTACRCLEEIEEFFPGHLESEIPKLSLCAEKELSPTFQSYSLLLSVCLKNLSRKLLSKNHGAVMKETKSYPDVSPIVSNLVELLPYMTNIAVCRILKIILDVVKLSPDLSPMTFRLYLQKLIMSSDVPLFHLALDLLNTLGLELFSAQEETFLCKQLVKLSIHPSLTSSHRLLFLNWLKTSIMRPEKDYFSSMSSQYELQLLLPVPFDGPLTQEKKSHILSLCVPPNSNESLCSEFLNESISGLVKCSLLPRGTKSAPSLFRILFVYFCAHRSEGMHNSMYRLISGIMKTSPHLTPYALSFLQSVSAECKESKFHERILGHMVEHILSIPTKQFLSNLDHYLAILEVASRESSAVCKPRSVLRLLQKFLTEADIDERNEWCLGNDILSVCRSILHYHDVQIFYFDLAEVLCLVMQKIKDIDVRDRAKIYYSMLISLSKLKVQSIFRLKTSENDAGSALSSFVTGNDSRQFASSIQKLPSPVLQLIRLHQQMDSSNNKTDSSEYSSGDALQLYNNFLDGYEVTVKLPFVLEHTENVEDKFNNLYGISIRGQPNPLLKVVPVIQLASFRNSADCKIEEKTIYLPLVPLESRPLSLEFDAEFTCSSGQSYTCSLPSVELKFEDLFMPLPVPESVMCADSSWKLQLFSALWDRFQEQIAQSSGRSCDFIQSGLCLDVEKEYFEELVEKKWKLFVVTKTSNYSYNIGVFLPPCHHFLWKSSVVNDKIFVKMLIDNKSLLPWLTVCFQNFKSTD